MPTDPGTLRHSVSLNLFTPAKVQALSGNLGALLAGLADQTLPLVVASFARAMR